MLGFNLDRFVRERVTRRERSLLASDFERFDCELRGGIDGKRVLVIGGAGSIGSHYIKALLRFKVAKLVVVDINENGLTELVRDLRSSEGYNIPDDFKTYPVSFSDRVFGKIFNAHGPFEIVANFAAHKHVRSEKDVFSIEAMVENNLLRARDLLELLCCRPPEHFFCVSTDKAANPVNIMGASKKLMEELILAYSDRLPVKTARFANVAFSNGSLLQGWMERLAKGQPWSCPLGIRRFFVSPMESGELCLLASILGESGDIIFPKLDEERDMIPFDRVAHDLLEALGMKAVVCGSEAEARFFFHESPRMAAEFSPAAQEPLIAENSGCNMEAYCDHEEVAMECLKAGNGIELELGASKGAVKGGVGRGWPVYFFESDTSGEKAFEEFYTEGEELELERFVNLGVVKNTSIRTKEEIDLVFARLRELLSRPTLEKSDIVSALKEYLPGFDHIETGKGLDEKM